MEKTLRVWLRPSDLLLFLLLLYLSLSSVCLYALVSGRLQGGERLRERQGQEKDPGGLHYPSMEKTLRVWLRPSDRVLYLLLLYLSLSSVCLDALVSGRLQAGERLRERQGQEKDPGGLHYPSMEKTLRVWLRPSDLLLFLLLLYLSLSSVCLDALVSGRLQAGERLRERQGQEKDPGGLHYPSMEKTLRVWL